MLNAELFFFHCGPETEPGQSPVQFRLIAADEVLRSGIILKAKGFRGVVVDAQVIHDEKQDKAAGWKKQWRTGKLIRESARVYMKKYLGCSGLTLAAYSAANVLGLVERYLITLVLG